MKLALTLTLSMNLNRKGNLLTPTFSSTSIALKTAKNQKNALSGLTFA